MKKAREYIGIGTTPNGRKLLEKVICIVAFSDAEGNSIAYKKFLDTETAVSFYRKQLENDKVNVISTRKTTKKEVEKND